MYKKAATKHSGRQNLFQPSLSIIMYLDFLSLDLSLNLDPSELYEKPKVLQNIVVQRALAVRGTFSTWALWNFKEG